jgi:hypothetical protein
VWAREVDIADGKKGRVTVTCVVARELRAVLDGRLSRGDALARYGAFSGAHRWKFEALYAAQQSIRHLHGRPLDGLTRLFTRGRVSEWAFRHYLDIAPPSYAVPAPPLARVASRLAA